VRAAFKTGFLVLVVTTLALGATELIARVIFPGFADEEVYLDRAFDRLLNSAIEFDPAGDNFSKKFGFVLKPNSQRTQRTEEYVYTSRTNSLGFRSREIAPKREGEYRVMLLGDSFFWGVGVEESETIAAAMERADKSRLSVHNFSVVGYNTVQELIVAKSYVDLVQPDHIVLGFFIGNDMVSNALTFVDENGNYAVSDGIEAKMKRELRRRLGVLFHSVIYRIVALDVYVPRIRYQIATSDEVIARSFELLLELDRVAKRAGARFSVVVLYPRDSVQGGLIEAWSGSRRAGELIASFCRDNSIEVLDLIQSMNTPEQRDLYFFEHDGHPNREGNLAIARGIVSHLIEPHMAQ
jgi:hypothetical protein